MSLPGRANAALGRAVRSGGAVFRARLLRAVGRPSAFALERLARLSGRRLGVALVYHRVGDPPGDLGRELVPALGASLFSAQVRHLSLRYRLVPSSELLQAARTRRRGERFPVAITFDDDLSSHVQSAVHLLDSAGVTATFFLGGASLYAPQRFWWERLQLAVDRGLDLSSALPELPAGGRAGIHALAEAIESLPSRERREVDAALRSLVGPDTADAGLQAEDVEHLARSGFEIGFHTRRHDRLPPLEDDELAAAMREGRAELEQIVGKPLRTIAYPHGRADARVAAAARAAGFETGFTGLPGLVTHDADPLLLGRLSPSYSSVGELAYELAWTLLRGASYR